ncbi:MAG: YsnF/AvaK domain-containing protein [Rhodopila sp.]
MTEHIVAVFRSEEAAVAAEQSLENIGVPRSVIRRYAAADVSPGEVAPTDHAETHTTGGSFWSWLFGEDETTRASYTHDAYERSVTAGHVVVAASVDDSKIHEAITALEAHDPVGIDERSDEISESTTASSLAPLPGASMTGQDFSTGAVAQAGPTGGTTLTGGIEPSATPATLVTTSETSALPSGAGLPVAARTSIERTSPTSPVGAAKGEQVIPLAEEQLEVGKRTVNRGTIRVRRYVVEKPVEESVTLRTERVTVERRQPIEGATPGAGAFEERVVEVREIAEEPVVAKTARVVEEVVIGREATERTETVKDTVRREDVEVSKDGEVKP